jgi:hypothetical protein
MSQMIALPTAGSFQGLAKIDDLPPAGGEW